jgi:tetratricopeptide (TPR) repeat protein
MASHVAMRSRLLARLDGAIAKARNPVDVACLRAERAGFLARQGHVDQARKAIDHLQAQFAWRPHAAVSAWLSLAEGLHDYYSHLGGTARDRIQRAYALSGAAHLAPLHALSAAWLAHMDYVRHDMAQMAQHVAQALATAAPDHHSARSRACLVVAYAYHFAAGLERALPWYARSRTHATADGDEAHLSALMHNQAWLRGSQVRLAAVFGEAAGEDRRRALMAAESSGHFDAGVGMGTASLGSLVPMLRAQMMASEGRHAEALELFTRHLEATRHDGLERLRPCFLADMAWCRLQLGDVQAAQCDAQATETALQQPCDIDDRVLAQARLAQVLDALGDGRGARIQRDRAERDLQAHRGEQARLTALLDETLVGVDVGTA